MSSGRPSSFIVILRMRRNGVSAIRPRVKRGRREAEQRGVDLHREGGRMGRVREDD